MKAFGDLLAEAYTSCISSVSSCCAPLAFRLDDRPRRSESSAFFRGGDFSNRSSAVLSPEDYEKDTHIFRDQPGFTPPPFFGQPVVESQASARRERAPRKSSVSTSRGSFSVRSRFWSNASSTRRPLISHPTNFRHLHSESFQFPHSGPAPAQGPSVPGPSHQARQRPAAFRPLELSIYMRDAKLSPIAPHVPYFESESSITPPRRAYTQDSFDSSSVTLTHQRSHSSMSFHIPRRPVQEAPSLYSHQEDDSPPRIPPRSRLRAYTSPDVDRIVERIASAMLEKERLQAEIDSVIERQSLYANSRPSTAYGIEDIEPMPSIPALPAAAPSFAERLSTDRPLTAPSRPIDIPRRGKSFAEATAAFSAARPSTPPQSGTRINGYPVDVPLAPPLPLVLRPPLRKKKSFSRVSNWLFPGDDSPVQRDISLDPITNHPMPVRDSDGFYQCVQPSSATRRMSMDSVSSVSTWSTEEDRTVPSSTWSPESTPVTKLDTPTWNIDRTATFGRGAGRFAAGARPPAVGVAY